jgi:hypothetical protein
MSPSTLDFFQQRPRLFQALRDGVGLERLVARMAVTALACAALYGVVLGALVGGWQVFSSPVKLPLILVGTALLCVAALYVMLALAGARTGWTQVLGLALCSVWASSVAMAALLPVAAFWTWIARSDHDWTILVHSATFGAAGWVGARFAFEAARAFGDARLRRVMVAYAVLYGLTAQQMAWIFRPHLTPTTVFMRPLDSGGSALQSIFEVIRALLG